MKNFIIIISVFLLYSCSSSFVNKRFTMVGSGDKEWEIELILKKDSTFIIKDEYGCNKMAQKGRWRVLENTEEFSIKTILLTDNLVIQKHKDAFGHEYISYQSDLDGLHYANRVDYQFPLIKTDTIYLVTKNKLLYKEYTMDVYNGDLQKKRVKLIEKFYIDKFGKNNYIILFGEGKSLKKARERFIKMPFPPMNQ